MALLPYNPYFDRQITPYYSSKSQSLTPYFHHPLHYSPFGWHPIFNNPLTYQPFAMLRAAEEHLWRDHYHQLYQNQPSITQNGEFVYQCNALGYKPDELGVDINGNEVIISGQHRNNKNKNGQWGHQQFYRRITLPENVNPESLKCDIDNTGKLMITGYASPNNAIEYGNDNHGRRTPIPIRNPSRQSRHQRAISY